MLQLLNNKISNKTLKTLESLRRFVKSYHNHKAHVTTSANFKCRLLKNKQVLGDAILNSHFCPMRTHILELKIGQKWTFKVWFLNEFDIKFKKHYTFY